MNQAYRIPSALFFSLTPGICAFYFLFRKYYLDGWMWLIINKPGDYYLC